MTKTEPERLAVLETKVSNIESGQVRIETKVDALIDKFDNNTVRPADFAALQEKVDKLQNTKQLQHWLVRIALIISTLLNLFAAFEYVTRR